MHIIWPKLLPISGPFPLSRPATPPPLCTVPGALPPAFPSPLPPQPENPLTPDTLLSHGSQVPLEWWRRRRRGKRHLPHLSPIQEKRVTQTESSSECCGLQIHVDSGVSPRTTGVSKSGSLVWAWRKVDKKKRGKNLEGSIFPALHHLKRPNSSTEPHEGGRDYSSCYWSPVCFSEGSASPQVLVIANRTSAKSRFSCPHRP